MNKLLILNCTLAKSGIERLNNLFTSIFEKYDIDYKISHLTDIIEDFNKFSHLLISGSALFASQENKNDSKLYDIVQQFTNKSILGICYGHQMLAKALMKKNVCRKSSTPELGWRKVELVSNSIFEGISKPVFYESHFEEVFGLTNDFTIIASNSNCDIQGYQYKNLPIWGLQFHPEITFTFGQQSIKNKLANYESMRRFFKNELDNPEYIEQNFKIFENFVNS
ncbi:MAG: hypothetical protein U9P73_00835 [Candidatus Cloacimonadota bacterium]|nr:hypothetical protein [Candidatus Cloacimonadota bacterium]